MSCDNSIYSSAILDVVRYSNPAAEPDESPKRERPRVIGDRSKPKGHRDEVQSHTVPDSTHIDPEYVWGDEGPINE
jgi:hypothetical protein